MKIYFTLICLFVFNISSLQAEKPLSCCSANDNAYTGYIVTLDGKKLTGKIGDIFFSDEISVVLFINDFGTPYYLQAELITGFVFERDDEVFEYESLFKSRNLAWSFLKVMHRGAILSLFKSPEEKVEFIILANNAGIGSKKVEMDEYWLKFKGDRSFKITRFGYKRKLKEQLTDYPSVMKKIGKTGYKFKDIETIVKEVNELYQLRKRTL